MSTATLAIEVPDFDVGGLRLGIRVSTADAEYGLDPAVTSARDEAGIFVVRAAGLRAADGRTRVPGAAILRVVPGKPGQVRIRMKGKARPGVLGVLLLLRSLPTPIRVEDELSGEAWPRFIRTGDALLGVRVEDPRPRVGVALLPEPRAGSVGQGVLVVRVDAVPRAEGTPHEFEAPTLVLARDVDRARFCDDHHRFLAMAGRS